MEYLAFYKDEIRNELLKFKNNNNQAVERWLKMAANNKLSSYPKVDYIIRALGSRETEVKFTPLDKVGNMLAQKLNARYIPKILSKKITQELKFLGKYDRQRAVVNSYSCIKGLDIEKNASFLIIDDVITTGSTGNDISRALRESYGNEISISHFALVYTPLTQEYNFKEREYNHNFYKKLMAA